MLATPTIWLPNDQHDRLKLLAARRGISLNRMFEEFSAKALAEADTEARFLTCVTRGNVQTGLALLDKLDAHYRDGDKEPY